LLVHGLPPLQGVYDATPYESEEAHGCPLGRNLGYLIQQGIPLYTVGAVLGHKNPATVTYRYAHLATDNIKDALETLARRLEK